MMVADSAKEVVVPIDAADISIGDIIRSSHYRQLLGHYGEGKVTEITNEGIVVNDIILSGSKGWTFYKVTVPETNMIAEPVYTNNKTVTVQRGVDEIESMESMDEIRKHCKDLTVTLLLSLLRDESWDVLAKAIKRIGGARNLDILFSKYTDLQGVPTSVLNHNYINLFTSDAKENMQRMYYSGFAGLKGEERIEYCASFLLALFHNKLSKRRIDQITIIRKTLGVDKYLKLCQLDIPFKDILFVAENRPDVDIDVVATMNE